MVAPKATAAEKSDSSNLGFTALDVIEDKLSPSAPRKESGWTVKQIIICSPEGEELELRSDNLLVVSKLLSKRPLTVNIGIAVSIVISYV